MDIHDTDLKLNEVFVNQEWGLNSLHTLLPDHLKDFLQDSHIHLNPGIQDRFIWCNSPNGDYTTKASYHWILQQRVGIEREQSWKWIWKIPAQENIKFFFWLAFHDSIPTLATLHHRNIIPSADCKVCPGVNETLLHCVRDCPRARRVWEKLGFGDNSFFQVMDAKSWLKQGATGSNDKLFIACVWWCWKARNAYCFNNEVIPFPRLILSILNLSAIFKICFDKENTNPPEGRNISWYHPNREGVILNVDGSSLGNPGPAGFGGLLRNPDGGWILGFSGHIGHSVILKAELLAILNGLKLAWERGFKVLYCYTDLMHALSLIKEQQGEFHRHATIIQDIRDLLAFPWKVEMHHTLREGNQCADFFAKLGASDTTKLRIFLSPPPDLGVSLAGDAAGVSFPRGFSYSEPVP